MSWKTKYRKAPSRKKSELPKNKYFKSWLPKKKLVIRVVKGGQDKLVHFGHTDYQDYTEHKDPVRRKSYLARAKGIKDKKGRLTYKDPFSPNYHAVKILW